MIKNITRFRAILNPLFIAFSLPSWMLFQNLVVGWILCPGRRFVTSIASLGDPKWKHSHDSYHRFFRVAKWANSRFWKAWTEVLVDLLEISEFILLGDDTVHKKTGRKVDGAKSCRDAVRSTKNKTVFCWGLQLVLLCLRVTPPWGGEPLSVPINMRLYRDRKKVDGPTILEFMAEMIEEIQQWFPGKLITFVGDGFYAPLAGRNWSFRPTLISRIRYDAALYAELPSLRKKGRGRPRTQRSPVKRSSDRESDFLPPG